MVFQKSQNYFKNISFLSLRERYSQTKHSYLYRLLQMLQIIEPYINFPIFCSGAEEGKNKWAATQKLDMFHLFKLV